MTEQQSGFNKMPMQAMPEVKRDPDGLGYQPNLLGSSPSSAMANVQIKSERLNGFADDGAGNDHWTSHDQQCCLVDSGKRCGRVAGNASYNKRIQKTVAQKKLKLHMDNSVSNPNFPLICM